MKEQTSLDSATENTKLRDRIFQQRLWIEQIKSTGADRETMRKAIVELHALVAKASAEMQAPKKRSQA